MGFQDLFSYLICLKYLHHTFIINLVEDCAIDLIGL